MNEAAWDYLHEDARHQLRYPSEHVIRWLAKTPPLEGAPVLDIGCGSGRHLQAFHDYGYWPHGIDASATAVANAADRAGHRALVYPGDARCLPFASEFFYLALAYGVFYYGTLEDHAKAATELHRVLVPGGRALILTRTHHDSRTRVSTPTANPNVRRISEGDEKGMTINFLTIHALHQLYHQFSDIRIEMTETTRNERTWTDSDWLIEATR